MNRAERRRRERQAAKEARRLVTQTMREDHGWCPDCGEKLDGYGGHYPVSLLRELVMLGLAELHDDHIHLPDGATILLNAESGHEA